jgi:hypothetical protein
VNGFVVSDALFLVARLDVSVHKKKSQRRHLNGMIVGLDLCLPKTIRIQIVPDPLSGYSSII